MKRFFGTVLLFLCCVPAQAQRGVETRVWTWADEIQAFEECENGFGGMLLAAIFKKGCAKHLRDGHPNWRRYDKERCPKTRLNRLGSGVTGGWETEAATCFLPEYLLPGMGLNDPVNPDDPPNRMEGWLIVQSRHSGWWLEPRPDEGYYIQRFPPGARARPLRESREDGGGEYFEDVAINYRSDKPAYVYVTRERIEEICEREGVTCTRVNRGDETGR